MIALRNDLVDFQHICERHVKFILQEQVDRSIDFYIGIFGFLPTIIGKRSQPKVIEQHISGMAETAQVSNQKYLLNALLKKSFRLKNKLDYGKLRHGNNYVVQVREMSAIKTCLEKLKKDCQSILRCDFYEDPVIMRDQVRTWETDYFVVKFLLPFIFDYDNWFLGLQPEEAWGPYQLTQTVNIRCCPYCNRQYTFSLVDRKGRKLGRPELDHFYPKSKHPLLALSFYNLIPSCHSCNSTLKGASTTGYDTHLSPYELNEKHAYMRFSYVPLTYDGSKGISEEVDIILEYNGDLGDVNLKRKVEGNIELFALQEIYKNHHNEVQRIVQLRSISSDRHIAILQETYRDFDLSYEEAYRLAYGNYFDERHFHKQPLAKLTKDIAFELGILPEYIPPD